MHFGFVFFLRKRDSIQFPNSEAVTRKKKHHLPWEVHNRKANNQSFPEQIQSKANKFMENTLAATGGFENTEYLKNCIASSCRHRSCLSLSPAESPSKALSLLGTHPNIISRINLWSRRNQMTKMQHQMRQSGYIWLSITVMLNSDQHLICFASRIYLLR